MDRKTGVIAFGVIILLGAISFAGYTNGKQHQAQHEMAQFERHRALEMGLPDPGLHENMSASERKEIEQQFREQGLAQDRNANGMASR